MTRIPDPEHTSAGPAYQGRLLDRPEEEVVDQGLSFDLGTLVSRRGILSLLGIGAGGLALAACTPAATGAPTPTATATGTATPSPTASATPSPTATAEAALPAGEIPDETAGPYPGDGSNGPDVLEQSGIVRGDIRSSLGGGATAEGVPLTFTLRVTDMANGDAPFAGVAVYAWHCDAQGRYSMYSSGVESETFLRGVQIADANGQVTFTSIFPGCYAGRWPHIHFEVYPDEASITDSTNAISTSQLGLPQSACDTVYARSGYDGSAQNLAGVGSLQSDNVFGDDGGALQVATVTGDADAGFTASLVVRVDTTTAPTGGGMGGSGGPGGRP